MSDTPYAASFGYSLAMAVLQSDLYRCLDDHMRAECDELIARGQGRAALAAPAAVEREAVAWLHEWTNPATGKREREAKTHEPQDYELTPGDTVSPLYAAPPPVKQTPYGPAIRGDVLIDAERLDWLASDGCTRVLKLGNRWYTRKGYGEPHHRATSLRAAIDAAIASQQEPK